ncbi:hypothetical protein [Hyphomicrobium sp. DY-1]|uniref:hypothetical protein n=1 Tax=Hyphomicrobium sp. DY-1 TaxID=3075650 RepID=UPI0039C037B0
MSAELFRRLAKNADRFLTACAFQAALGVATHEAGIAPEDVKKPRRGNQNRREAATAALQEAIYLTVVHYERPQRSVSRAIGLTQPAIHKGIRAIESRRDDPAYDRKLDELQLTLMGAA